MNEQTLQLVAQLAEKLGTTTHHLWQVLIVQARISSTIDCCIGGTLLVAVLVNTKLIVKLKNMSDEDTCNDGKLALYIGACILEVIGVCILIFFICSLSRVLAGFFNPEYWALQEVLSKLK